MSDQQQCEAGSSETGRVPNMSLGGSGGGGGGTDAADEHAKGSAHQLMVPWVLLAKEKEEGGRGLPPKRPSESVKMFAPILSFKPLIATRNSTKLPSMSRLSCERRRILLNAFRNGQTICRENVREADAPA